MARPQVTAERRNQILDGLFVAMADAGSDAASVTEIAARSGLPRGVLHYYFSSKDEMRRALMRRMAESYLADLRDVVENGPRGAHGEGPIKRLIRYHFRGDPEQTARNTSVWIDFWGQAPADKELARIIADVQEGARRRFAEAIVRAQPGLPSARVTAMAACAQAVVEGLLLQWRVCRATGGRFDVQAAAHVAEAQVLALLGEVS
ncbi:MAG: TetR/AcrR family transcriptional regulator [Myxococcota bacterium]